MITCLKNYNGFYGYGKCKVKGDHIGKLVFLEENADLRTNENF